MKKINLRELYPDVYTTDFFVDVTEEVMETIRAVSYTHLDVYKRQAENSVAVQGFDDVKVTVDDPENLKQMMEQVKHLPGYEENANTMAADDEADRKSTRLNSSHSDRSRMPSSA